MFQQSSSLIINNGIADNRPLLFLYQIYRITERIRCILENIRNYVLNYLKDIQCLVKKRVANEHQILNLAVVCLKVILKWFYKLGSFEGP